MSTYFHISSPHYQFHSTDSVASFPGSPLTPAEQGESLGTTLQIVIISTAVRLEPRVRLVFLLIHGCGVTWVWGMGVMARERMLETMHKPVHSNTYGSINWSSSVEWVCPTMFRWRLPAQHGKVRSGLVRRPHRKITAFLLSCRNQTRSAHNSNIKGIVVPILAPILYMRGFKVARVLPSPTWPYPIVHRVTEVHLSRMSSTSW